MPVEVTPSQYLYLIYNQKLKIGFVHGSILQEMHRLDHMMFQNEIQFCSDVVNIGFQSLFNCPHLLLNSTIVARKGFSQKPLVLPILRATLLHQRICTKQQRYSFDKWKAPPLQHSLGMKKPSFGQRLKEKIPPKLTRSGPPTMKEKCLPKVSPYELDNVRTNPKGEDPWCPKPKSQKKVGVYVQKRQFQLGLKVGRTNQVLLALLIVRNIHKLIFGMCRKLLSHVFACRFWKCKFYLWHFL